MQEVQILAWCDNTGEGRAHPEHTKIPATDGPVPILLPNRQIRLLDLCQSCQDKLVNPIQDLAAAEGRKEDAATSRTVPSGRSVLPSGRPSMKQTAESLIERQRLGMARHGRRPSDNVRDLPCLLCELEYASDSGLRRHYFLHHHVPRDLTTWTDVYGEICPICGGRFGQLGGHAAAAHEGLLTPQVFRVAQDMGDPHGVVAGRIKYLQEVVIPGKTKIEPAPRPGTKPGVNPRDVHRKRTDSDETKNAAESGLSGSSARRPLSAHVR